MGRHKFYGRFWDGYIWQAAANVSVSPAYAIESTVSLRFPSADFAIAWADARNGETEIYLREWGDGFGTARRITNLTGSCRRPSVHAEQSCGDMIDMETLIAFQNDQTGHVETWTACYMYDSVAERSPGRTS